MTLPEYVHLDVFRQAHVLQFFSIAFTHLANHGSTSSNAHLHLLCTARVFSGEWVNYFSLLSHKFLWVLTHFSKQLTHFSEKDTKPNWITMSTHWRHLVAAYWNCSLNSKYHQHLCELSVHNKSSCSQPIKEINRLKLKASMNRGLIVRRAATILKNSIFTGFSFAFMDLFVWYLTFFSAACHFDFLLCGKCGKITAINLFLSESLPFCPQ